MAKEGNSFIPVDEANQYIGNYIQAYFNTGKFPIKSVSVDAASLRDYLNAHDNISNVKIVLAQRDGGSPNDLTTVLVGYDANGNYVINADNTVLDQGNPCPNLCPNGKAGDDLIS
jgi:hypothetical protein